MQYRRTSVKVRDLTVINEAALISSNFHFTNTPTSCLMICITAALLFRYGRQVVATNDYRYINTIQYDPAHKVDASNACIQSSLDLS